MTWGIGPWGAGSSWGAGVAVPAPTLTNVVADVPEGISTNGPAVVDARGGTVLSLLGTGFSAPATVEVLAGGSVVAEAFLFDDVFDLSRTRVYVGSPALEPGLYGVRVTTEGGVAELADAIAARPFADEYKTASTRGKFAPKWLTGPRILRGS